MMFNKFVCWLIGHKLYYTEDSLDGTIIRVEYSHCERCQNYSTVTGVFTQ